jgi:microcystin-dependent protein
MSEPFLSEIKIVPFNFPPKGWAQCNGQLMPINQNQALFSLLGNTYGGNGQTNFALPDFRGRAPMHVSGTHLLGERSGEEFHTLTVDELPAHGHSLVATTADADTTSPAGTLPACGTLEAYAGSGPGVVMQAATGSFGGGQAHLNMQPFLTLNFIIALQGIFPSPT